MPSKGPAALLGKLFFPMANPVLGKSVKVADVVFPLSPAQLEAAKWQPESQDPAAKAVAGPNEPKTPLPLL